MSLESGKISIPKLAEIIPRERLFQLLDIAAGKPLIWICAPAGAGKSTLAGSWVLSRHTATLWYRLDSGDHDPATFFHCLTLAAASRCDEPTSLPLFSPEDMAHLGIFARGYFQALFQQLPQGTRLVLDDYQEIPEDSALHAIMVQALAAMPGAMSMLILSRHMPPRQFCRQRVAEFALVDWQDLRFSLEESALLVRQREPRPLSEELIGSIYTKIQGWAAGLVLAAEGLKRSDLDAKAMDRIPLEAFFDFFANEVFFRLDTPVQEFLVRSAFLPEITVSMAERVTGNGAAGTVLRRLARSNCFIERSCSAAVFRYHPLFRAFLLDQASEFFDAPETASLLGKTAGLIAAQGRLDEAVLLFTQAQQWTALASVVTEHAERLMAQGRHQLLQEWLAAIPEEIVQDDAWLLYWLGACVMPRSPVQSRSYFSRAFQIFVSQGERCGILCAWCGAVESLLNERNDYGPLDFWIDWLDCHVAASLSFPSLEIEARVAVAMVGALQWRRPYHPQLELWIRRLYPVLHGEGEVQLRLGVGEQMADYYFWRGDLARSCMILAELRKLAASGSAPISHISLKWLESFHLVWAHAAFDDALAAARAALSLAQASGVRRFDPMLQATCIACLISTGETVRAGALLNEMHQSLEPGSRQPLAHYHYLAAWHALRCGDLAQAAVHGEMSLVLAQASGLYYPEILARLAYAQVLLRQEKQSVAAWHLSLAGKMTQRVGSSNLRFRYLLAAAQAAYNRGEEDDGDHFLREGLVLGRGHGYLNLLWWWENDVMAQLCLKALERGIEQEYAGMLVRGRNLFPEIPPLHLENWPWPLKIYTFGRFSMLIDDKPVPFSRKAQQKPLALLKALIALGGREVSEEQLSDHLWPDSEGAALRNAFNTNLHRLRKLLGNERTVLMRDGKLTLNPRYCWVDAWAFERGAGQLEAMLKEKRAGKETGLFQELSGKVLGYYKGGFLAGDAGQLWAISRRERLRSRYLHLVTGIGQFWEDAGQWEDAAQCYRKGLQVDDLVEEFYQRLMICCHHLGRQSEVLMLYNRCRTALAKSLGISPSAVTIALFRKLEL